MVICNYMWPLKKLWWDVENIWITDKYVLSPLRHSHSSYLLMVSCKLFTFMLRQLLYFLPLLYSDLQVTWEFLSALNMTFPWIFIGPITEIFMIMTLVEYYVFMNLRRIIHYVLTERCTSWKKQTRVFLVIARFHLKIILTVGVV